MRTIEKKVYQFSELDEQGKEKALNNCREYQVSDKWWESIYEDAKEVKLKLDGFDADRGNYCNGKFIESAEDTAHLIIDIHGTSCNTYNTAEEYLKERDELINTADRDENGEFINGGHDLDRLLDELDENFLKSILEDYLIILRNEFEYLTSDESIEGMIDANVYEFTEEGKRI